VAPSRRCQFYLFDIKDADGEPFNETKNYRLSVPPDVPFTQYWSATLYDRVTHALIRDVSHASRSSQSRGLVTEPDGSVNLHFGPVAPNGTYRVVLGRPSGPPALTAREPTAQPRPPHGRRHPNPQPGTEGRIYFERKVAEGKTKKEALRSLKRQISNAVYRQLLLDAR
jgi:hypothetical protein